MCQLIIFGSLTLRKTFSLNFGVKCSFSKIRIEHIMLKFLEHDMMSFLGLLPSRSLSL